jgi:TRAP-type mannitol/chloroaromatic compound transport system permease small subunit
MPKPIVLYVRYVDAFNHAVGRLAMYMIFAMLGVLMYSSFAKTFTQPSMWTLEMAQFLMAAYYILGGPYSMQLGDHVRMDLWYGTLKPRRMAFADTLTSVFLLAYLVMLLYGSVSSTTYAIQYKETSYSSWSPYMAPIKIVMTFGIFLMILQTISFFFKDIARARGMTIDGKLLLETDPLGDVSGEKGV